MDLVLSGIDASQQAKVFFAGSNELSHYAYLAISAAGSTVVRETGGDVVVWKKYNGVGKLPWKVRIVKKGNFLED